ncbi:aminoacyl-tRNA hydrolase [Candidatus Peregrinibacteria bacterium]|nr:aminoacyl-tRNA hydrolase [Candidatus Peregrinibacteria bacterium]
MKLIVGLGNPGKQYEKTRHNAGFMAVDFLAEHFGLEFKKSDKHKCELAEGQLLDEKAILLKPQTFMNLSGQSVQSVVSFYKIDLSDIIVIYDDVDIPSGNLKVRPSGSPGTHNGMRSVTQLLGSEEFIRIRLGIAPLTEFKGQLEDYVLGKLSEEEESLMQGNVKKLPVLFETLFDKGIEEAMQEFN